MAAGQHAKPERRSRLWVIVTSCGLAVLLAGVGTILIVRDRATTAAATDAAPPAALTAALGRTNGRCRGGRVDHLGGLLDRPGPGQPHAHLTPAVPGQWVALSPSLLQFQATGPLVPGATETITVPGGPAGVVGSRGQHLADTITQSFTVAAGSILRLQELLAELGYLPLTFTPAAPVTSPAQEGNDQQGIFSWRWPDQAAALTSLWTQGVDNVITQGAIMNYEAQHGLKTDGVAGAAVWADLLADVQSGHGNALSYDYVLVQKTEPETATVYVNGISTYQTLVNTGVAGAPTEDGTWPVYARYLVTTMTGTNPDGTKYSDPGIPWVSYFHGGDALHGFNRGSYGYPQSDGCVEMPPAHAKIVYPLTPLGTLVTVR